MSLNFSAHSAVSLRFRQQNEKIPSSSGEPTGFNCNPIVPGGIRNLPREIPLEDFLQMLESSSNTSAQNTAAQIRAAQANAQKKQKNILSE